MFIALITGGEGWHNNHHRYPSSARQGFRWWQIDTTYYGLRLLSFVGIVHDLRKPPVRVLAEARDLSRRDPSVLDEPVPAPEPVGAGIGASEPGGTFDGS